MTTSYTNVKALWSVLTSFPGNIGSRKESSPKESFVFPNVFLNKGTSNQSTILGTSMTEPSFTSTSTI